MSFLASTHGVLVTERLHSQTPVSFFCPIKHALLGAEMVGQFWLVFIQNHDLMDGDFPAPRDIQACIKSGYITPA